MTAAKFATSLVPMDPTSTSMGGYVVACVVFYERGFSVPSHQFLHSLLWYYGLELHHLTHSGILHIAAFVTLCESFIGIEPHFDLWWNFYWAWQWQGLVMGALALGSVDIYVTPLVSL
jgi:hypothetical protein